jgi:O-antigen/teichoic acid export membrane protein
MLLSLNSYAPQYALKQLGSDAELGVFATLLYVAMATRVLTGAAGQAASPRLAKLYEAGDASGFRALHRRLLLFGLAVGAAATGAVLVVGRPLLDFIFGAEYAAQARLLVELSLVSFVAHVVSLQGFTVTATREFRAQFPVSLLVALTTVTAAWALVPRFGAAQRRWRFWAAHSCRSGLHTLLRRALQRLRDRPEGSHVSA